MHRTLAQTRVVTAAVFCFLSAPLAFAASPDPLAVAFGKIPETWGARLSPDGKRVSFLHMIDADIPVLFTTDEQMNPRPVLASREGKFDIAWCNWVNDTRLLCGFTGIDRVGSILYGTTRLVAVNADGSQQKVLLQRRLEDEFAQFQDRIVDWLPDDPENVLIMVPETGGNGVGRLNVYTGAVKIEDRKYRGTYDWISDGRGTTRLRKYISATKEKWYYRLSDSRDWHVLHERRIKDIDDDYHPVGFGESRDALLIFKNHEGRRALFSEDLLNSRQTTLVFAHPEVDVGAEQRLGKHDRLVAVGYITDRPHLHFFDETIRRIAARVRAAYPGKLVQIVDESWDRKTYLVHISSDQDPGKYHLLNLETNSLMGLWEKRPELNGRVLGEMQAIHYQSRDAVPIPGYLTLPPGSDGKNLPAIVLPHGGPESRDVWDFDWLSQFMAAKGYAVLQANFRGSGGYGEAWAGEGGFKAWRRTIGDLTDGTNALVTDGIADPDRICVVGWSYGGYAALMSVVEEPEMYKCSVSIAGVTDPLTLIEDYRRLFLTGRGMGEFVGNDDDVIKAGSPLKRAGEIKVPVLMFHGKKDLNVTVKHSKKMHKALNRANKDSELVLYDDVSHSIWRSKLRIDMLDKIGVFLDRHIGEST